MNAAKSLRLADEVKTFPSIEMPTPIQPSGIFSTNGRGNPNGYSGAKELVKSNRIKIKSKLPPANDSLPGLLKGSKPPRTSDMRTINDKSSIMLGFSAANLLLDGEEVLIPKISNNPPPTPGTGAGTMSNINLSTQVDIPEAISTSTNALPTFVKNQYKADPVMDELKKYLSLMDEYSLHNFIIYDGRTLKETPEFDSFKRTYFHVWGAISFIIERLEGFLSKFEIKLAVINGHKVFELSLLNLSYLEQHDLLGCIANTEQVKPYISTLKDANTNQHARAAIIIQTMVRRRLAILRVAALKRAIAAAIRVQSYARLMIFRMNKLRLIRIDKVEQEKLLAAKLEEMKLWWRSTPDFPTLFTEGPGVINTCNSRARLLIHIPTISCPEYLRLDMENFHALQNTTIGCLYQLADPDVSIVYVTPVNFGPAEIAYNDKIMALMGINSLPKRLHYIYPEMIAKLPQHVSLAQSLLCSNVAIKKIRWHLKRFHSAAIISSSIGWAERKLSSYLTIPVLGPDDQVAMSIQSRSFTKGVFMDSSVNIPLGAHDIHKPEDLLIAISRLISTNVDIRIWAIRLNCDFNNESVVILDMNKFPLIDQLRREQAKVLATNRNNPSAWFSKQIQFSVRKRVVEALSDDMQSLVTICRRDIYPSWDVYLRFVNQYGAVVESEPLQKIGYVKGMCFVDPLGEVHTFDGADLIVDGAYQTLGTMIPQTSTPPAALAGATKAVATILYSKYNVIGYISVQFVAFWDGLENIPRLWGTDLHFGKSDSFNTAGIAASLIHRSDCKIPKSLVPSFPQGRYVISIPYSFYTPLKGTRDDIFFRLIKMRGISFDADTQIGTLFFLVDAVVGGAVNIFIMSSSRRRCLELAIFTLTVICQQFGKVDSAESRTWEKVASAQLRLKQLLKSLE